MLQRSQNKFPPVCGSNLVGAIGSMSYWSTSQAHRVVIIHDDLYCALLGMINTRKDGNEHTHFKINNNDNKKTNQRDSMIAQGCIQNIRCIIK
jgi:hypothetical protein